MNFNFSTDHLSLKHMSCCACLVYFHVCISRKYLTFFFKEIIVDVWQVFWLFLSSLLYRCKLQIQGTHMYPVGFPWVNIIIVLFLYHIMPIGRALIWVIIEWQESRGRNRILKCDSGAYWNLTLHLISKIFVFSYFMKAWG
jgi:hypothetical protein